MHLSTLTLTAAAALAVAGTAAGAAELVDFRFTGNTDPIDENAGFSGGDTSSADNVSITMGLTAGSGLRGLGNQTDRFRAFDLIDDLTPDDGVSNPEAQTLAQAVAQDEFFAFTAQADDGFDLDLAGGSVDLTAAVLAGGGANSADQVTLFTSVDGFDVADALVTQQRSGGNPMNFTFAIPDDARFDDLTGPVEFRLVFSRLDDNPATNTGGGIELFASDDAAVTLNGEVTPIPEPATAAAGLAGLGLLLARRRRD